MLAIVVEHYPSGCVFGHDEEGTAQEAVGVGEVKRWLTKYAPDAVCCYYGQRF